MKRDLLELAASLHKQHRPFVIATVVWSRSPTSGKAGSTAIIELDGTVHGWIGGACAEPSVAREARRVMNDGESRLMYLGPSDELDGSARPGVVTVPIACASEGALEVFMEPVLPQPHVVVVGRSPGVKTLARLLTALDWRATAIDDGGNPSEWADGVTVRTSMDEWDAVEVDEATAVVVATQGHYDEPALEAALASPASYIGLVASATRAASVIGYLRDRGYDEETLARIDAPAGIDLGHIEHREIAVAIVAELVRRKAAGAIGVAEPRVAAAPATAIDPVCGMTVDVAGARFSTEHEGETVYFCCPACKSMYEKEPASYG